MRDLGWGTPQAEREPGEVASRSPACLSTVNRGQKGEGAVPEPAGGMPLPTGRGGGSSQARARRAAEGPLVG